MKKLNRKTANITQVYPERILQFGGGNFLRGFVDWIIDRYNRHSNDEKLGILAVKVREGGSYQKWKDQEGLYHLFSKGYMKGRTLDEKILIKSVSRVLEVHQDYKEFLDSARNPSLNIVISNTTETGLEFNSSDREEDIPSTFPGQLCRWLEARWKHFGNDKKGNCVLIPCELLTDNGEILRKSLHKYVDHWSLSPEFKEWIETRCSFCNTLVDRIVPGINRSLIEQYQERTGYEDAMMTEGEPYHLWAIETSSDLSAKLPLDRIGLNVIYTEDLSPFRERKLKILNGSHTAMVPVGLLMEVALVKEAINHATLGPFIGKLVFSEIVPSLEIDKESSEKFAEEVLDRFRNPFLEHKLQDIALYSISKFNARLKPTVKAYVKNNREIPKRIALAFASLLLFYRQQVGDMHFTTNDVAEKVEAMKQHWMKVDQGGVISPLALKAMLADTSLWEENLNDIPGFADAVSTYIVRIMNGEIEGMVKELST